MLARAFLITVFVVILSVVSASAGTVTLPTTGQTKCYNTGGAEIACAGTGQDGEYQAGVAWPAPRFVKTYCDSNGPCLDQNFDCDENSSTDIVLDNLTGLIWARDANLGSAGKTWADSLTFANDLTLCGYTDWRLPNAVEMESLVHRGQSNQQTWLQQNSQGFVNVMLVPFAGYWTSTTVAPSPFDAWFLSYDSGSVAAWGYGRKSRTDRYLWPVRGTTAKPAELRRTGQTLCYDTAGAIIACDGTGQDGEYRAGVQWPGARFTLVYCDGAGPCVDQMADCDASDSNNVMKDNLTGLTWTTDASPFGTGESWTDTLTSVNNLTLCGYSDWRLPNVNELKSLVNYGQTDLHNWMELQGFFNVEQGGHLYWSSTTLVSNSISALSLYTTQCYSNECYHGQVTSFDKTSSHYAWPVRDGCTGTFADVPGAFWAAGYIKNIYCAAITTGCTQNPMNYCTTDPVKRQAMAAFIIRAKFGETFSYNHTPYFTDVPAQHQFFKYIQKMRDEGITTGCNPPDNDNYCPTQTVNRQQMAAFIIRALYKEDFPYTAEPLFNDVANTSIFFKYIQKMSDDKITTGCNPPDNDNYCPTTTVNRASMAAFLARAFLGMP